MRKLLLFPCILLLGITVLTGCKKNTEFGPTQTDFVVGSIYQAKSDGLLTVHYKTSGFGTDTWVNIYLDQNADPTTLYSEMAITSSSTISVHKNDYWKVVQGLSGSVKIEFTPFQ